MIVAVVLLVALVAVLAYAVRRGSEQPGGPAGGHAVRRFFQYLLLLGLLVVAATGVSGLLGRVLERPLAASESELALAVAFTVVGVPLYVVVAAWSRRMLRTVPGESRSLGWAFYATAATLTSLVVAAFGLNAVLRSATGLRPYDNADLAQLLVWGGVWTAHWWVDRRVTPADRARVHHLAGSLIGLATAATGLATLLAGAIAALAGLGSDAAELAGRDERILQGGTTLVVGAVIWLVYWVRTAARSDRDPLWLGYVLLAGVGGGLATAIVSASTALYTALVWLVGDPRATDAATHFERVPSAAGAAVVGLLVWWYHHAVLAQEATGERTEVQRIYEYLMAGVGLLAAAAGLSTLLVALVEGLTRTRQVLAGQSTTNTVLAAATLLVVGVPVWALFWRRIQRAAALSPVDEHSAPTRRVYLFVLFGLGGVAAVVSLLIGVYLLIRDTLTSTPAGQTLYDIRIALGVLVSTAAISAYHWAVYRGERDTMTAAARGPRYVLLVGAPDPELVRAVAHQTGGRVQAWRRVGDGQEPWTAEEVMTALESTTEDEVIVLADEHGLHAIPVNRG